jgi:filamentous hemagglutinin
VAAQDSDSNLEARFPRAELLGEGAFKAVYAVRGRPDLVIAVDKQQNRDLGDLGEEMGFLEQLREAGIPTVDVVAHGSTVDGRDAIVMRRHAAGSREGEAFDRRVNRRTVHEWRRIRQTMQEGRIGVWDLQFLIGNDGSIVVNDPLVVVEQSGRSTEIRQYNQRFRRAFRQNQARRRQARQALRAQATHPRDRVRAVQRP